MLKTKQLQITMPETQYDDIARVARQQGMTAAEWAHLALSRALQAAPPEPRRRKSPEEVIASLKAAADAGARNGNPTPDEIARMLPVMDADRAAMHGPQKPAEYKLAALAEAVNHRHPTADIAQMLRETAAGAAGEFIT